MMVVSEIGEQWSPHTAPARQAEIEIIISSPPPGNTAHTIGNKIPKVPQDVPVENAKPIAITNTIAGNNHVSPAALALTNSATNTLAPKSMVMPLKVHAKVRIIMAGTIALKPSVKESVNSLNVNLLVAR